MFFFLYISLYVSHTFFIFLLLHISLYPSLFFHAQISPHALYTYIDDLYYLKTYVIIKR